MREGTGRCLYGSMVRSLAATNVQDCHKMSKMYYGMSAVVPDRRDSLDSGRKTHPWKILGHP